MDNEPVQRAVQQSDTTPVINIPVKRKLSQSRSRQHNRNNRAQPTLLQCARPDHENSETVAGLPQTDPTIRQLLKETFRGVTNERNAVSQTDDDDDAERKKQRRHGGVYEPVWWRIAKRKAPVQVVYSQCREARGARMDGLRPDESWATAARRRYINML